MSEIDSRAMELMCLHCAEIDPENRLKWLGQAERWRAVGTRKLQKNPQVFAGPMAMGPNTINGDARQMG